MSSKCNKCKLEFNPIDLYGTVWTAEEQFNFHKRDDGNCAKFHFDSIHYLFFTPMFDENVHLPVDGLPTEVGNISIIYAGETDKYGLTRPINQPFKIYHNRNDKSSKYHDIYRASVAKNGLYLMIVEESTDYNRIQTSEYVSICSFRSMGEPFFHNQNNGKNSLKLNDKQFIYSQNLNYRRIEYKLKNKMYIKLTERNISELEKIVGLHVYNYAINEFGSYYHHYTKNQIENLFNYLYELNPSFFCNQIEPQESDLVTRSFFEKELNSGCTLKKVLIYMNNRGRGIRNNDKEIERRLIASGLGVTWAVDWSREHPSVL